MIDGWLGGWRGCRLRLDKTKTGWRMQEQQGRQRELGGVTLRCLTDA